MASGSKPPQVAYANDAVYASIGKVVSSWATLDVLMHRLIWDLANVSDREGACITSQIPNSARCLDAIIALVNLHSDNGPVRSDQLEQVVWDQVKALLEQPDRVAHEYRRRIAQARDGAAAPDEILHLDRQISSLRRGIGRLIDSYAEGVIDKAEFEPRITGLKQRMSQLEERHEAALEAAAAERDLSLVISRLEDFSARVTEGLDALDERGRQEIVRALVRRIEIDDPGIEVIFRVPSLDGPAGPPTLTKTNASWHHCSGVRRAHLLLVRPKPTPRQGLREPRRHPGRVHHPGLHPPRHKATGKNVGF